MYLRSVAWEGRYFVQVPVPHLMHRTATRYNSSCNYELRSAIIETYMPGRSSITGGRYASILITSWPYVVDSGPPRPGG